ncbi:MAG: ATP-binding protein [Verrucomicrobiota bacterium]
MSRKSRTTLLVMGLVGVGYIGMMDYVTGPVALLVFYLVPVCFVAWFAGCAPGIVTALAAAAAWYMVKVLSPESVDSFPRLLWNLMMRFGVFGVSAILTAEVAERRKIEEALRRAHRSLEQRVEERTLELGRANAALQSEVMERTRAQANLKLLNEILEERVAERSTAAETRAAELARSESALRQQKGILQSMLNSMGDGVIVADARGEILLCNPACERFMRAGMGEVSPQRWMEEMETHSPEGMMDRSAARHVFLRAMGGEVINGAEFFLRGANGSEGIWLSATGRPLMDEKGNGQGGVVVLSDITARKLLEKQIAEISDREQRRIGQDLHDGLCQHLVSVAFAGELLREKLARQKLAEAAQAEAIVEMVNDGISEARNLARGLYPVRLEVDGLASALEELAAATQARTGILCRFCCDAPVCIFDEVAGSNLYRIAQEAVNNAVKHADCRAISIGLGAVEEEVTLTIKDDGAGFPGGAGHGGGMGISIMNYRAKMIGASLEIRPGAGGGTIVICSFHNEDVVENQHVHSNEA